MSLFVALLLLGSVQAEPSPATPAPAPKKAAKTCRDDPSYTGTRMRKKLCLTQAEWDLRSQGKNAGDLKVLGAR